MTHDLNQEQRAAVRALSGPVLISAGAGSGKTRTLCERFTLATHDVPDDGWSSAAVDQILAITFTDKAAGEIAERVRATLRQQGRKADASRIDGAWISTIHGLCNRLLRRYALEAGLDPAYTVADSVELERLRESAFDAAARREVEHADVRGLFEALRFADVYGAVIGAAGSPSVQLRGLSSLRPPQTERSSAEVLSDARELFLGAAGSVAFCDSQAKTAAEVEEHCSRTCAALFDIEAERLDEVELARRVQAALATYGPRRTAVAAIAQVREHIESRHRELCVEITEIVGAIQARAIIRLVTAFAEEFAALKRARGVLDFDDLQIETRRLLLARPDVRERCRALFRLTMVDEFQDTDALQTGVIQQLAGDDLCTIGDERQAIYGFRGADVGVFRAHVRAMGTRGARAFQLRTNYRSHRDILGFVNALFGRPEVFGEELIALAPGRTEPDPPVITGDGPRIHLAVGDLESYGRSASRELEAMWVATRFAQLRDEQGLDANDMVVLVRGYTHADVYAAALRQRGFEAAVVGGNRLFGLSETAMVRVLLRVIANPHDETALVHLLAGEAGRITDDGLWLLARLRHADQPVGDMWEALASPPDELGEEDRARARTVREAVDAARVRVGGASLAELLLTALEQLDADLTMLSRGAEGKQAFANVLQLTRMIRSLEDQGVVGPAAVEARLAAMQEYGVKATPAVVVDEGSRAVRIMSVHAAKGLEFPVVAAVELDGYVKAGASGPVSMGALSDEQSITVAVKPHSDIAAHVGDRGTFARMVTEEKAAEAEESKRLFYVACTRAQEALLLSGAVKLSKPPSENDPQPMTLLRRAVLDVTERSADGRGGAVVGNCTVTVDVLSMPDESQGVDDAEPTPDEPGAGQAPQRGSQALPTAGPEPITACGSTQAPVRLSFSDVSIYQRCSMRFHAERVARVGRLEVVEKGGSAGFGSAVHLVLQLATTGQMPASERIDAIARAFSLGEEGRAELESAAQAFLGSAVAAELLACDIVKREWPFVIRLQDDEHFFDLSGSLDAYGRSGDEALIIDYKTGGRADDEGLEERYRLQAGCYALAAAHDGCKAIRIVFVRPQVCDEAGRPQVVEFSFGRDDVVHVESQLKSVHERMRSCEYAPLRHWDSSACEECPIARTACRVPAPPSRPRS
ncbi:MAG: UvrD-helicase domain-containing protein [Coriobacteriia bacterium]|nr:UvrD-helicase domain-containing protein [Coriobacteriia bacterium]